MALEFEKIAEDVEEMVRSTRQHQQEREVLLEEFLEKLRTHATDWERLEYCLNLVRKKADRKKLRAARPLNTLEPLNVAVDPPPLPPQGTIIASDGSQILPDHHAPYLYSLINVGIMMYFHGSDETPVQLTLTDLNYPGRESFSSQPVPATQFSDNGALVSLRRDRAEIEALARMVREYRDQKRPILALLDQRLLYWPAVGAVDGDGTKEMVLQAWQEAMTAIRKCDGLLAGYIVRPRKQSILNLLRSLEVEEAGFDIQSLMERDGNFGLNDAMMFAQILRPGQRSKVFVDVSQHNDDFRQHDPHNEVCFFYLNPGHPDWQIARVDLPLWVARDPVVVNSVHALIYDQCQILGNYPYVLVRADEIAVIGRRDQENLNLMIENAMQRQGITAAPTAKQSSKDIARAGRKRHGI
jgi:hypothetical protein